MPGYVPPLDLEQNDLLNPRKSGTFRHASIQYFLAWRHGKPCGRIAAIHDPIAITAWGSATGAFGALDAIPDKEIVHALLNTARQWLRERGLHAMRGPLTLGYHGESGIMVEGQGELPMIATPWHPAALHLHLESWGLEKVQDLLTYRLPLNEATDNAHIVPAALQPGTGKLGDVTIERLSKKQIARQGEVLRGLYNDGWNGTFNFVPLQSYEMESLINQLKPILRPEHYVQIDKGGVPVAMALAIPNMFDIAGDLGGSPSIAGWVKLGYRIARQRFHTGRVILLGVAHEVRNTMLGAMLPSLAIAQLLKGRRALGYDAVELGWILESNTAMRSLVERLVPAPNKIHRLYEAPISRPSEGD